MKIGLIIDRGRLCAWQADALLRIAGDARFIVYNCTNAPPPRRRVRHALYYALNLASLRTRQTRGVPLPPAIDRIAQVDFACAADGGWQRLPDPLLERIASDQPDAIVKFGMGLLRVPPELSCPILSYHHGDPRAFRGRPAGFYELMAGRDTVGQVVQILSDRLDAGKVVAFAETKAHAHSWRRTMAEAYRASPLILSQALRNAFAGRTLPIEPTGTVTRLPSSWTVIRFVAGCLTAAIRRLAYGAFVEKAWEVAEADLADGGDLPALLDPSSWRTLERPAAYRFLADPFHHPAGGILVEALRSSTGRGEILHVTPDGPQRLLAGNRHYSYPATITVGDESYLVPEVCEWSPPLLFRLRGSTLDPLGELNIPRRPRLMDPTLYEREGTIFLFANLVAEGEGVLRLWFADGIYGEFVEHPASPIRISPAGARMGGSILERNGTRFRVGQDFRRQYGDGVLLFRIEECSPRHYSECLAGELRFGDRRGPHTLNLGAGTILFDFYRDRFSPLAGLRRLRSALVT